MPLVLRRALLPGLLLVTACAGDPRPELPPVEDVGGLGLYAHVVRLPDRQGFSLGGGRLVRVTRVLPGSPAAAAGVQAGDVLREVDGQELPSAGALIDRIAAARPGTTVVLTIDRADQERELTVTVGPRTAVFSSDRKSP